jgi:hypothetical protein
MTDLQAPLSIPVSTTGRIDGKEITGHVGPVFGLIVRSTGAGGNLKGTFKAFKQGEVVGPRFDSTDMGQTQAWQRSSRTAPPSSSLPDPGRCRFGGRIITVQPPRGAPQSCPCRLSPFGTSAMSCPR